MFVLLGNDVEDDNAPPAPLPKEIVKQSTSSKKADVAPASADPAKARKNKKSTTGNEAALKNKTDNKSVSAPSATPTKHQKKPFDRHSRTGKTDSKKKFKQGWGEDAQRELEGETKGAADAIADIEAEAEATEAAPATKSLQDYLAELQKAEEQLGGAKPARKANEGAEDKWTETEKIEKKTEEFFSGTAVRKTKQKANKEKKFLDFSTVFADEAKAPKPQARGPAKRAPATKAKATKAPAVNDQNFPSL